MSTLRISMIIATLMLSGLSACEKTGKPDAAAPTATPAAEAPTDDAGAGAAKPELPADAGLSCVEECVRRNQMRAEPIEQIRADCARECTP